MKTLENPQVTENLEDLPAIENPEDLDVYECTLCGLLELIPETENVFEHTCKNNCFQDLESWNEPFMEHGNKKMYYIRLEEELQYCSYTDKEIEEIKKIKTAARKAKEATTPLAQSKNIPSNG